MRMLIEMQRNELKKGRFINILYTYTPSWCRMYTLAFELFQACLNAIQVKTEGGGGR